MPSTERGPAEAAADAGELEADSRRRLLELADASIRHGLEFARPLAVMAVDYPAALRLERASFVTLDIGDNLRGCIGRLEASRPLVEDVADNAFSAAFRDPRFPPLTEREYPQVGLHISILSPSREIEFSDQADLLDQIRPGVDGLILMEGSRRGTFLPSVWESLPEPERFLAHLKVKAGLPSHYWSDDIRVLRYTTESFGHS